MPILQTIKNIKNAMGLGQANFIPGINFGTGTPRQSQVLGASTNQPDLSSYTFTPGGPSLNLYNQSSAAQVPTTTNRSPAQYTPSNFGSTQGPINTVNQNAGDLNSQADYEFEQALSFIGQQEQALRGEAGVEEQRQTVQGESAKLRAGQAKQAQLGGLEAEQQVGEKTASSGLKQARDLFRQIQQQNIAQLSGLGISSSSVTEALAERLGVETAQRIAGVTGSLDEVRQNIAREKTRVEEVFQTKLQEIADNTKLAIDTVRANLQTSLAQLAAARGQAATAKAQARTDIAVNARNQIQQIQLDAYNKQQAVQAAAAKREQALAEAEQFMFKPTDFTGLQNYVQNVSTLPQVAGFQAVPTFTPTTVQGQGFIQPGINYEKKPEEEIINPFAT